MKKAVVGLLMGMTIIGFQNCAETGVSFSMVDGDLVRNPSSIPDVNNPPGPVINPGTSTKEFQTMSVDIKEEKRTDILFVVDNSGSMKSIQKDISQRLPDFIKTIDSLDWQIAVTTTDMRVTNTPGTSGSFVAIDGLAYLKKGDRNTLQAQTAVSTAINVGIAGSGTERGIAASYAAISKIGGGASDQKNFFRHESRLVVILISDEDECSNGSCVKNYFDSQPASLVTLVRNTFGFSKIFKFHSIVKIKDSTCVADTIGATYMELSASTGGIIGDICSSDYTQIVGSMANDVVKLTTSVNLPCPVASFSVTNSQGAPVQGAHMSGTIMNFPDTMPEGRYDIKYLCH